ncbi:MAG TPA: magnesium-translocating P-type ATPase [Acidimicrobiales bacterium]|nr:magnesium-translocating P-type ATPase [Acidimicrobiales bacterium]
MTSSKRSTMSVTSPAGHGELLPEVGSFWAQDVDAVLRAVRSDRRGLAASEAADRLRRVGRNTVGRPREHRGARLLAAQFTSPIILILVAATVLSMALGDITDGVIILTIIVASGVLGFWQEHSAGRAVDALLDQVRVDVEALRDGREGAVPIDEVVPGDVVVLRAGDIVPADCRVVESHSLLVDESALTGESFPVEKVAAAARRDAPLAQRTSAVFSGTHAVSGTGTVVAVATGAATQFGALAAELESRDVTTRFERGITAFGLLLVRAMVVLVTAIFTINVVLNRPLVESLLFSLALAVGLTPQLLPAIVAVSLSSGARRMATEKVIVKRLDVIEDFGTMTVLCTDKTGTLTVGGARLDAAVDLAGEASEEVLRLARLNAGLQHGFSNPLDAAILAGGAPVDDRLRLDEVPYDFERKRLSVLVAREPPMLVTKGAYREVLAASTTAQLGDRLVPLDEARTQLDEQYAQRSVEGYRVLAVATRDLPGRATVTAGDERELTVRGLLAFADPPKAGAADAIEALAGLGVSVRMITGDNHLAARQIASAVGLAADQVLTGGDIDRLDDHELAETAGQVAVFAEVDPMHKERVVRALRASGATVGFLGDGINDSAALHAADVGISVDTAVDVAKQSAAIVLLDKSLDAVAEGVRLGRRTFANTMKYVRVTTSANFGNMLSMAAAAVFLPFLPLLPRQILLLNFMSDIPGTTIAADAVDREQLERPRAWDIGSIRRFMITFGLISSAFDLATFAVLRLGFHAGADLFRSGWFVESTATELAVMLVLRTRRPFWRSRPGHALLASSVAIAAVTVALPYSPLAGPLGLVGLPLRIVAVLTGLTVLYVGVNEAAKRRGMVTD